jgi:hypothetical protein
LRQRGIDVLTLHDAGLLGQSDIVILAHCHAEQRVIVTNDRHFVQFHDAGLPHAGIAFSEQGRRSIGELLNALTLLHDVLEPEDMVGRFEFL